MKNPPNPCNKNNDTSPCPLSPHAADTVKKLAESIDDLTSAAAKMAANDTCPDFLQQRAWQRAERVGHALDALLNSWEAAHCPALCVDCQWQHIERALAIINTLTPCNQWFSPELWEFLSQNSDAPPEA